MNRFGLEDVRLGKSETTRKRRARVLENVLMGRHHNGGIAQTGQDLLFLFKSGLVEKTCEITDDGRAVMCVIIGRRKRRRSGL